MELVKKNVHMNRLKGKSVTQLTLDDDFNVSDVKPDIDQMIKESGDIKIESVKVLDGKVLVKGKLYFKVLYSSDTQNRMVHNMAGEIPFEEPVNMDGVADGDNIRIQWDIEDLSVSLINSRKLSVKAIVTLMVFAECLYDAETAVDVSDTEPIEYIKKSLDVTQLAIQKKDTFRVKEEMEVSANKPNIFEILWSNVEIRNPEVKLLDDKINIRGELLAFVLYSAEEDNTPVQWMENSVPFSGMIDVSGCREEMIPNIELKIADSALEPKPDYDGEQRIIGADIVIELDIKIYEEDQIDILSDVYSAVKEVEPVTEQAYYESLLVKNISKCKVVDRIRVDNEKGHILQICNSEGSVKLDDMEVVGDGIQIDGVVYVSMLYVSSDDRRPLCSVKGMIPFSHKIEAQGIDDKCMFYLKQSLEQLTAVMVSSDEIEVKATVALDALVLKKTSEPIIVDIKTQPLDLKKIQELPGIVGYLVQNDDTLWKIAKKFYTTVDSIKEINELKSDTVKKGDRLLVVKKVEEMSL